MRSLMGQWDDLRRAGRTKQKYIDWLETTAEQQQETIRALQKELARYRKYKARALLESIRK